MGAAPRPDGLSNKALTYVYNEDTWAWEPANQSVVSTDNLDVNITWPTVQPVSLPAMATVLYQDGTDIYVCEAPPGTALNAAAWQIQYINTASGVVIQWCDGNANFDNTATDLSVVAGHSYS